MNKRHLLHCTLRVHCLLSTVRPSHRWISQQECPAVADKPARRETMPKIAAVRR